MRLEPVPESVLTGSSFDYRRLLEEWSGNETLLWKLLNTINRESASGLAALEAALADNAMARVTKLAHRIKGSAAVVGAWQEQEQAAMIEAYGRRCELGNPLVSSTYRGPDSIGAKASWPH
jgi:HPt (histidine-containing phosphotransfer) domain-containing protein